MLRSNLQIRLAALLCAAATGLGAQTFDEGWGGINPSVQPGTAPEASTGPIGAGAPAATPTPTPAPPPTPVSGAQAGVEQMLQGAWFGQNGQKQMLLIIQGNTCGMALNGQQKYGVWSVQGDKFNMSFQDGKQVTFQFVLSGDELILDQTVRLRRQNMPNIGGVPGTSVQPPPAPDPAPVPQPVQPSPGVGATPLEGSWVTTLPMGQGVMAFRGNQYTFSLNGQMVEAGTFTLGQGVLNYTVTMGQMAGSSGQNRLVIQGNQFAMTTPAGQMFVFMRSGVQGTAPIGQPPIAGGVTPLEGRWAFTGNTTGKYLITEYRGNMFFSYYNGRLIESSQFQFSNGQITHYMLSGAAAGSRVVMNCTLQGNRLVTQVPGRTAAVWIRQ